MNFDSADAYMISGIWLLCLNHPVGGCICVALSLYGCIVYAKKKGDPK